MLLVGWSHTTWGQGRPLGVALDAEAPALRKPYSYLQGYHHRTPQTQLHFGAICPIDVIVIIFVQLHADVH